VAHRVPATNAEGPGHRYTLWLQGCPLRCPGCCNLEFLSFEGGEAISICEVLNEIDDAVHRHAIEGISLLGGEPTSQATGVALLAREVQNRGLSVMLYSGFTLSELKAKHDGSIDALLHTTDILVDGPYDRTQPETSRRWIGSANQIVHFLSDRYRADDPCWTKPNTLEIRVNPAEITVNGFPASDAKGLWKGWARR
jgi:anaerobic ribonucleoside-triphosphate reductase activating protein